MYCCKTNKEANMSKIFSLSIGLCLLAESAAAQMTQPYVRKKIQPNFFIPEGALAESQPEKVSLPQYRKGQTTAKRISAKPEMPAEATVMPTQTTAIPSQEKPQPQTQTSPMPQPETTKPITATPVSDTSKVQTPSQIETDTPQYQKMYQDYLKDLEKIARDGTVSNLQINKDLSAMNSEKRIQIDQEFNSHRNVKNDILKALENN